METVTNHFFPAVSKELSRLSRQLLAEAKFVAAVTELSQRTGARGWEDSPHRNRIEKEFDVNRRGGLRKQLASWKPAALSRIARAIDVDARAVVAAAGGRNVLMVAVAANCHESVRLILRNARVDVNATYTAKDPYVTYTEEDDWKGSKKAHTYDALRLAIMANSGRGGLRVLDELLKREDLVVSVSAREQAVESMSCGFGPIRRMVAAGRLDPATYVHDTTGVPLLHLAAFKVHRRRFKALKKLIELGADANCVDAGGRTVLHALIEPGGTKGGREDEPCNEIRRKAKRRIDLEELEDFLKVDTIDLEAKAKDGRTAEDMAWDAYRVDKDHFWWAVALYIRNEQERRKNNAVKQCKCACKCRKR